MKLAAADVRRVTRILGIIFPSGSFPKKGVIKLAENNYGLYLKTNKWDSLTENFIFQKVGKHFRVEPGFWGNSRTLDVAKSKAKSLGGALIVEHPKTKSNVFTLYILIGTKWLPRTG